MRTIIRMSLMAALVLSYGLAHAVEPIQGTEGEYMSPYTSDGVTAEWVNKSINASMGSAVGSAAGAYAGAKAAEQIPIIGGLLGSKVGEAAGRKAAIEASGGEDYMRETSDLSFNSLEDMAAWMYQEHGNGSNFDEVLKATQEVYPDLEQVYPATVARVQGNGGTASTGSSASSTPATVTSARQEPAGPAPAYTERPTYGGVGIARNRGELDSTGLALAMGVNTAKPQALGLFFNVGLMQASGYDTDVSEVVLGIGPAFGFGEHVRGYAGVQMDGITYEDTIDDEELYFTGLGYRVGAQFLVPQNNVILDLGVRKVDAEDDGLVGEDPTLLEYTGLKASLEYGFTDGAGLWLGYEERDVDSSIYLGIRGRFGT